MTSSSSDKRVSRFTRQSARIVGCSTFAFLMAATAAHAQTDFYNTDAGRPLTIEDASATERYAFELQLAPLRLERGRGGVYSWGVEPELAYGILPRTQLEIGAPLAYVDASGSSKRFGLAGLDVSLLHNLNVETAIPALAIAGDVLLPVGRFAPDAPVFSAKGIATRTLRWARFHINGQYSFGDADDETASSNVTELGHGAELSRWLAGISVDRTFPLKSTLIGAEVFARKPLNTGGKTAWNAAVGIRKQLSPTFNIDAGVGKQLSGDDRSWFATFGLAHAFAVRSLLPGG
ncbi:MAG TPA: transporter [Gemmatimonadaceae bacterium]|nr:transporter [Gemmatimonadaceae bacterium]